jgi:hypothetical protein
MTGEELSDLERIAAAQKETLEALESLKQSKIPLDALEEIECREQKIILEIENLINGKVKLETKNELRK